MQSIRLSDLDELVLSVRDKQSQFHILEALNAYRGGAYRAAIVTTWIAVTYDVIAKIRELASNNDPAAEAFVRNLNWAIQNRDLPRMQKIEQGLLDDARKDFELLAEHEVEDFQRLQKDRNRCAHPAFVADDALFQPSPELVRTHIVHAITHLLQHQPVQGKSALARIMIDLKRASFPAKYDDIYTFLADNYLNRAKDALVRNLVTVLLKALLQDEDSTAGWEGQQQRLCYCLLAVSRLHSVVYNQEMKNRLPQVVSSLEDKALARLFRLLATDASCWQWMRDAQKTQLKILAEQIMSSKDAVRIATKYALFGAMAVSDLSTFLMAPFGRLNKYDQEQIISSFPRPEFADTAVALYGGSGSYRGAESRGADLILPLAQYFAPAQIEVIIHSTLTNRQIWEASGTPRIIEQLFDLTLDYLPETARSWVSIAEKSKSELEWYDTYRYSGLIDRLVREGLLNRDEWTHNP